MTVSGHNQGVSTTFGQTVENLRKKSKHPSRRAFAEEAGISSEYLRRIEHGDRTPADEKFELMLDAAGVPESERGAYRELLEGERGGAQLTDARLKMAASRVLSWMEEAILDPADMQFADGEVAEFVPDVMAVLREALK